MILRVNGNESSETNINFQGTFLSVQGGVPILIDPIIGFLGGVVIPLIFPNIPPIFPNLVKKPSNHHLGEYFFLFHASNKHLSNGVWVTNRTTTSSSYTPEN